MSTVCTFQKYIQKFRKKWEGQVIRVFVSVVILSEHPVCSSYWLLQSSVLWSNKFHFSLKSQPEHTYKISIKSPWKPRCFSVSFNCISSSYFCDCNRLEVRINVGRRRRISWRLHTTVYTLQERPLNTSVMSPHSSVITYYYEIGLCEAWFENERKQCLVQVVM